MPTAKQRFQLAGLAEAWLRRPRRYRFELKGVRASLDDAEEPQTLFVATLNDSMFDGLVVLTDRRVHFARFRWLWRKPVMLSLDYEDVHDVQLGTSDGRPTIVLGLSDSSQASLMGTEEHSARFRDLVAEILHLRDAAR